MSYFSICILAIALSIDACVVSFSYGLKYKHLRFINSMLLASFTAVFQGLMPLISYYLTNFVRIYIQPYANLIVFLIFSYLGLKFIIEAFQKAGRDKQEESLINIKTLFLIGIATSVDAFSAGISLSLYGNHILKPVLLISGVTFINSKIGFFAGGILRNFDTKKLEILAGILLLLLAIKSVLPGFSN